MNFFTRAKPDHLLSLNQLRNWPNKPKLKVEEWAYLILFFKNFQLNWDEGNKVALKSFPSAINPQCITYSNTSIEDLPPQIHIYNLIKAMNISKRFYVAKVAREFHTSLKVDDLNYAIIEEWLRDNEVPYIKRQPGQTSILTKYQNDCLAGINLQDLPKELLSIIYFEGMSQTGCLPDSQQVLNRIAYLLSASKKFAVSPELTLKEWRSIRATLYIRGMDLSCGLEMYLEKLPGMVRDYLDSFSYPEPDKIYNQKIFDVLSALSIAERFYINELMSDYYNSRIGSKNWDDDLFDQWLIGYGAKIRD